MRSYRREIKADDLINFEVLEGETDLLVWANRDLTLQTQDAVRNCRTELQTYINENPRFETSLEPVRVKSFNPPAMIKEMAGAAKKTRVGPMAAVAGAIAESVGWQLLKYSSEIIIQNNRDLFIKSEVIRKISLPAGLSPFCDKIALEIDPADTPIGIGTVAGAGGSSLSFGKADAVVVLAKSAALADAAATTIGNIVKEVSDFEKALEFAKKIRGLNGVLIIKGEELAVRGKITLVRV